MATTTKRAGDEVFIVPRRLIFAMAGAIASGIVMFAGKWYADREADIRQSERFTVLMRDVSEIKSHQGALLVFQGVTAQRLETLEKQQHELKKARP